ncbi:MAG: MTH1187 family thiamine-binding protein [Acidobacteria bacterium]|nr:MTH1187 family thiamine-binding protein [Acidobacteriota bacterium]
MRVIMDLCVVPLGAGLSLSPFVAVCEKILQEAGLKPQLHANGTNIEGEWDTVMAAVQRCHEALHAMGVPRISTTIKLGTRTDREQTMEEKVTSVLEKMAQRSAAPAPVPDPERDRGKTRSADGTLIAWSRRGEGPPLVLIHGTDGDGSRWVPVTPALARRFTLVALDRRGRGASGDAAGYSLKREVDDVAAVIDAAGPPVVLLGHSFGAICALEAAARRASAVSHLILYEPPINTAQASIDAREELISRLQAMLDAGDGEGVVRTFLRERVLAGAREPASLRSLPARGATAHTILRELRAIQSYRFQPERFARLQVPVLLLLGGNSPSYLKAATEALRAVLPDNRLAILPGQGHIAMDAAGELFTSEVLRFLEAGA